MLHGHSGAQLEKRLAVTLVEFVQDGAPRGSNEGFEEVRHGSIIGKSVLACQARVSV